MFRIKICHNTDGEWLQARLTSKNVTRLVYVGNKYYLKNDKEKWSEFKYQLIRKCREMIRDELLLKYGSIWRKHEQQKQALMSALSAVKRMKPAKIKQY